MKKVKMVDVYFDAGFEDIILEILKREGINEYYKFPKVLGKTAQSEPKLDGHIWPGYFILISLPVDEENSVHILNVLKKAGKSYKGKGFAVYVTSVEREI